MDLFIFIVTSSLRICLFSICHIALLNNNKPTCRPLCCCFCSLIYKYPSTVKLEHNKKYDCRYDGAFGFSPKRKTHNLLESLRKDLIDLLSRFKCTNVPRYCSLHFSFTHAWHLSFSLLKSKKLYTLLIVIRSRFRASTFIH